MLPSRGRGRRRWALVPALLRDPSAAEAFDGASILDELRDDAGLLLWQIYRDTLLWAAADPAGRQLLFRRGWVERHRALARATQLDAPVRLALNALSASLRAGGAGAETAARACVEVADLMAADGKGATACGYASLALLLEPRSAPAALHAARVAGRFQRLASAEMYLRRALGLARRAHDWPSYGAAHVAMAEMRESAGETAGAARAYRRALRVSRRKALVDTRRAAFCGLLRMSLQAGDLAAAKTFGAQALRLHGVDHPGYPTLALDAADVAVRQGRGADAVRLLSTVPPHRLSHHDQFRMFTLQLAASGVGARSRVSPDQLWDMATRVILRFGHSPLATRLLLVLAEAAEASLGGARADAIVTRALGIATEAGSDALADECRAHLRRLRDRRAQLDA